MEPKSHTSKNCFIDTVKLGLAARSGGPVENTWELWQPRLGTVVTATAEGHKKP